MLRPILSQARKRKFLTYDLEWFPTTMADGTKRRKEDSLKLRLVGVYDGKQYRHYRTIAGFLEYELTHKNRGKIFFAHAGGSYDFLYILEEIAKRDDYEVEATFSGSSAVIVKVRKDDRLWIFGDSFFLLRDKLAKVGELIGMAKGDKANIYTEDWDELRDYNELDCVILYKGLELLQEVILDLGGEMKATLASTAMSLFRRQYLNQTIDTRSANNELFAQAYYASRVEVFGRECLEAKYYDINSSFPYSMTQPQPGNIKRHGDKIPNDPEALFIADVEIEIRDCYLPPLPYREKPSHRILFPTGRWRAMFDCADIRVLEERGERMGHRIHRVHSVTEFEPFSDLNSYVQDLYARRKVATARANEGSKSDAFMANTLKLLMNALYGKFAEGTVKEKVFINPESTRCPHNPPCEFQCMEMLTPHIYKMREAVEIPHAHLPISCHITALSRRWLLEYLEQCTTLYYCDTDSIVCSPLDHFETSSELGGLKLEHEIANGYFAAPKLYTTQTRDGKRRVKAKGYSGITYNQFRDLIEGRELMLTRMARPKESINIAMRTNSNFAVEELAIRKKAWLLNPKRRIFSDGSTRPWSIKEIEAKGFYRIPRRGKKRGGGNDKA